MVKTVDTSNGGYDTKNQFFDDITLAIDFASDAVNHKGNSAKVFDADGRLVFDTAEAQTVQASEEVTSEDTAVAEETVVEEGTSEEVVAEETTAETPAPKTRRKKTV